MGSHSSMKAEKSRCSIVIAVLNGVETLSRCLDSIVRLPALFALAAANLYERFKTNSLWGNIAVIFLLAAPLNLLGIIFGFILPENPDIYLDNIILGRKR